MAAQVGHGAPSGRFIRAYLLTWGLLAAGGLTYLASLAWHPEFFSASQRAAAPDPTLQTANLALTEARAAKRSVTEIQNDLSRLKSGIDQREAEGKARLTALEDRVTNMAAAPAVSEAPTPAPPTARLRALDKAKHEKSKAAVEPSRAPAHIISVTDQQKTSAAPAAEKPDESKIETGSIVAPPPAIVFGEAEVTPVKQTFAVQLAAGPSLDALRLSWSLLRERHGGALASLQPRYLPPRSEGGAYRLLAGPLPSKADADKVCADLAAATKGCYSIAYAGEPL
jgi:sporulation related protein